MELPARIRRELGDETLDSAVALGDEDLICFTPTRTLLYRGEGLLSDESIEVYDHDVDRLDISEGRRKTAFVLTSFDSEERFTVSRNRTEPVLERLLTGVLRMAEVIDADEAVDAVFRFSELTLIVTDARLVKHVGTPLWDADYEEFAFADVTGLEFEEGSVATYIVVSVDGRPQRIKAPRRDAEYLKRALTAALFSYYDVDSIEELNDAVGTGTADPADESRRFDFELDDSIEPLVTPDDGGDDSRDRSDDGVASLSPAEETSGASEAPEAGRSGAAKRSDPDQPEAGVSEQPEPAGTSDYSEPTETAGRSEPTDVADVSDGQGAPTRLTEAPDVDDGLTGDALGEDDELVPTAPAIDPEDIELMKSRLATLTKVAKRQNRLLKQQQETIDQLVEALKRQ